jgi:hypothetical protein
MSEPSPRALILAWAISRTHQAINALYALHDGIASVIALSDQLDLLIEQFAESTDRPMPVDSDEYAHLTTEAEGLVTEHTHRIELLLTV